jgi:hypothetical protein
MICQWRQCITRFDSLERLFLFNGSRRAGSRELLKQAKSSEHFVDRLNTVSTDERAVGRHNFGAIVEAKTCQLAALRTQARALAALRQFKCL